MGVILVDLGDESHDIMVSNAGWRKTIDVLRPLGVIDSNRLQRLDTYWVGIEFNAQEAESIGKAIVEGPLQGVNWSDNVYPPEAHWIDPGRKDRHDYDLSTYWPSWLRAFAGFCLSCKGFVIY